MATETASILTSHPFISDVGSNLGGLAPERFESIPIPQTVFDRLPNLLGGICEYFAPGFERDIFLTAAMVVCSGIFSAVKFHHRDKWYHLNLYALITAPPGSGKGDAGLAWDLAQPIDKRLFEESKRKIAEWELQKEEIEAVKFRNKKRKKDEEAEILPELPPKPKLRTLRIAVNSSARAFIDRLESNDGDGILFDTEIKTLNLARKQEWGDTEAYLKGFHNEPISIDRAGGLSVRIDDPHFAAFLTGTPEAAMQLIHSAQDGLFSRFIPYRFERPIGWRSHRPSPKDTARESAIKDAASQLDRLHQHLAEHLVKHEAPLYVSISDSQWDRIDGTFGTATESLNRSGGDRLLFANIGRTGLIAERIACILSLLRHFQNGTLSEKTTIRASDEDVECGIELAQTYLSHAIEIAKKLPIPAEANLTGSELQVLNTLSETPTMPAGIANRIGLSIRTVQRSLKSLCERGLAKSLTAKGPYINVASGKMSRVASVVSVALDSQTDRTSDKTTNTPSDNLPFEYGNGEPAF